MNNAQLACTWIDGTTCGGSDWSTTSLTVSSSMGMPSVLHRSAGILGWAKVNLLQSTLQNQDRSQSEDLRSTGCIAVGVLLT